MKNVKNSDTKLVDWKENRNGDTFLVLKRGNETKQVFLATPSVSGPNLSELVYDTVIEYYLYELNWTQEKFDQYWENGGEDKEIDNYVDGTVDYYDDWSTWEEIA